MSRPHLQALPLAMKFDLAERQLLEALLDAEGLSAVLRTLADVCGNKARRALAVHHDEATAQAWKQIAIYLDEMAYTKTVQACPFP
jgi:hypothetical protein